MAMRWSPLVSMTDPLIGDPVTAILFFSSTTFMPIPSSPSFIAEARSDSFSLALSIPVNSLVPSATAARTATVGSRSMQLVRSALIAFNLDLFTVIEFLPTFAEAPISLRKSSIALSPCKLSGFRFSTSTSPDKAPRASRYEAEDQSPSTLYLVGL